MKEAAELELRRASESVALIHDIRGLLKTAAKGMPDFFEKAGSIVNRTNEILEAVPDPNALEEWNVMVAGLRVLVSQAACLAIAQGGEGDLLKERAIHQTFTEDLLRKLSSKSLVLPGNAESIRDAILRKRDYEPERLCSFLLAIPLPTLFREKKEAQSLYPPHQNGSEQSKIPPLVRLVAFLDRMPIVSPKFLRPSVRYSLKFQIRGLEWPREAVRFRLNLLTTCPESEYALSEFTLDPPRVTENGEYRAEMPGTIKFNSSQSSALDDTVFAVHGAFEVSDGNILDASVIGLHELRFKVLDEGWLANRGNRPHDKHIHELVNKLCSDCPTVIDELPDLWDMLEALTNLRATYAQEAIYKGVSDVPERDFHATALRDLRLMLGQDVQEHTAQAGGFTDIRYRGVIVELKVERENGDREHIAQQYTSQVVQYASGEAKQASILLVLDLTLKDKPPGDIRDDILLCDVPTHGGDDCAKKYPSKVFLFVINGNMKSPSDYSR